MAGPQGEPGATGAAGPAGVDAQDGEAGPVGSQGSRGEQGEPGELGASGENGETGAQGESGERGEKGEPGENGQLRIYGDGSAGEKIIAANELLRDANPQYTDFVVEAGVTLTVPSGTVIRCTGDFINRGTIRVNAGVQGGFRSINAPEDVQAAPHPGGAHRAATHGELGSQAGSQIGGVGGLGLSEFEAHQLRFSGLVGGGGGGAAGSDSIAFPPRTFNVGSSGGGTLVVLVRGMIVNEGPIIADGQGPGLFGGGGGGGGGGIVILASATQVSMPGEISARGGAGQNSDANEGPSGGGGGVIHLIAPLIDAAGNLDVRGGRAGVAGARQSVTAGVRSGGAGGGASGGSGGAGGAVTRSPFSRLGNPQPAEDGRDGFALQTEADPTALF